jgi:tetratricopeptide (TPR) repeat protein
MQHAGVRLSVLVAVAAAAFAGTRMLAGHMQERTRVEAAASHERGLSYLADGQVDAAIDALSRALARDRGEVRYALAYAGALAEGGHTAASERTLVGLRERVPENPQVNLALARLAAPRGEIDRATQYYRSALYAPWPSGSDVHAVRLELIRMLLAAGAHGQAVPEIAAAAANAPGSAPAFTEIGALYQSAGQHRLALDAFGRALQVTPDFAAALRGAARAAFDSGNYEETIRYLDRLARQKMTTEFADVARLVVQRDPLAPRLRARARVQRLTALLNDLLDLAASCRADALPESDVQQVRSLVRALVRAPDDETLELLLDGGVALGGRLAAALDANCPAADLTAAVRRIAARHSSG